MIFDKNGELNLYCILQSINIPDTYVSDRYMNIYINIDYTK